MKKSKIIIPALAVLAFSTTAAVTGTVAWFTAASAVDVKTTSFKVTGIDGSLSMTLTGGIGTKLDATDTKSETIIPKTYKDESDKDQNYSLTHGSFNYLTQHAYSYEQELPDTYLDRGALYNSGTLNTESKFCESSVKHSYNIFSWEMTFKLNAQDDARNLYFGFSDSKVTDITVDKGSKNACKAFRIALYNKATTSKVCVWSPYNGAEYDVAKTGDTATKSSFVKDTKTVATYEGQTTNVLIHKDTTLTQVTGGTAGASDRIDCLGTFTTGNSAVTSITVVAVAWFEGTDKVHIQNGTTMPSIDTTLNFYVRKAASK